MMKKLLSVVGLLSLLNLSVPAQYRVPLEVQDIATLVTVNPAVPNQTIVVKDALRGGIFQKVTNQTSTNSGVKFASATAGYSWQRIFSGPLDVQWFGATGNGTDNDTAAIQAALTAAATTKGNRVGFPPGEYLANIVITNPVVIEGSFGVLDTGNTNRIRPWDGTVPTLEVKSGGVILRNLRLYGTDRNGVLAGTALKLTGGVGVAASEQNLFEGVVFHRYNGKMVHVETGGAGNSTRMPSAGDPPP